jgi:hypothetical protein
MEVEVINYPQPISCVKPLDCSLLRWRWMMIMIIVLTLEACIYSSDMVHKFWLIFVVKVGRKKFFRTYLCQLVLYKTVYNLWRNRNKLKYGCRPKTEEQISQHIFLEVRYWVLGINLGKWRFKKKKILRILVFTGVGILWRNFEIIGGSATPWKAPLHHIVTDIFCWMKWNIGLCYRWCSVELRQNIYIYIW